MGKLQLTGQTLGRVFNSRNVCKNNNSALMLTRSKTNLKLKTQPKQLFGYLPRDIALPGVLHFTSTDMFSSLVRLNASVVSLPLGDINFAQLASPLMMSFFYIRNN